MSQRRALTLACALSVGSCLAIVAHTQAAKAGTTGVVNGVVYAESYSASGNPAFRSAPMPGAQVYIVSRGRGTMWSPQTTKADKNGFFSFVSVGPGEYLLYAMQDGWQKHCLVGARVAADEVTTLRLNIVSKRMLILCGPIRPSRNPSGGIESFIIDQHGIVLNP